MNSFARPLTRSRVSPLDWPVARFFAQVKSALDLAFDVFAEAKHQSRAAKARYPFSMD